MKHRLHAWLSSTRARLAGRPHLLVSAVVVAALLLVVCVGAGVWFLHDITAGLPDGNAIRGLGNMAQATTIYDDRDAPVFSIYKEQRIEVPLEKVSPLLVKAVISVEDQRFYEHNGVDLVRIAAAAVRNVETGRRAEGGSTITQQLARQSFLTRNKTIRRKLKEVVLASHIEREYSKNQILELYLNKVYLGDGLYGVEAASLGYFGKHANDLALPEAALIAGLIQSPSAYAPTENMDRAIARRNVVLQTMVDSGAINRAQYEQARHAKVVLKNAIERKEDFGLYYKAEVQKELVDRFGWTRVAEGGLKVYTTLDAELQRQAEKIVDTGVTAIEHRKGYPHPRKGDKDASQYLQGALVSIDPSTGAVRALVGGRDFTDSSFDRATQAKRQPGSAFKPFVYAAALQAGYTPATLITNLNDPTLTPQGSWVPEDEHVSATSMTMRSALRVSSNRAAVQMLNTIGIQKAVSYAQKMNLGTPPAVPSLALGASEVTLLSLTSAYGAFADEGMLHAPVFIRRIEDADGKVLYETKDKADRVVSDSTAYLMSSMLADVVNAGTAYKARQSGFTLPAAGKTGTTNDYVDAWFVGYTPKLVTGVWVGFDQPQTITKEGYAGDLAVPIWASFMKTATKGDKAEWFKRPSNIVAVDVCRLSGKLPNSGCNHVEVENPDGTTDVKSMVYTEYFVKGTQPTTVCPLHPGGGFVTAIAGALGIQVGKPVPADEAVVTPSPSATTGVAPAAQPDKKQDKKKKRGFWSKFFGIGGKDGGG